MKQNKGIASIAVVLLIVLGAVIGGGAYFLGKSENKKEIVDSENLLQDNNNQESPVVENRKIKDDKEGNIYLFKLSNSIYSIYDRINSKVENRKLYPITAFSISQLNTKETCPFVTKINFKLSHKNITIPLNTNFYLTDEDGFNIGKSGKLNNQDIITIDIPTDGSYAGMCIPWQWARTIILASDNKIFEPNDGIDAPRLPTAKVFEVIAVMEENQNDKISCSKIFLPEGNNSWLITE